MNSTVIVAGARTPIGRLLGGASGLNASELGACAMRAALDRSDLSGSDVDYVIQGQVLTAGAGQLPARQAAAGAGIPLGVPSTTVSKVCLSGIQSIILADQLLRTGDAEVVIAGGQESMSRAPHLLDARTPTKFGAITLADHMALDGLTDAFSGVSMGVLAERGSAVAPVSRIRQDASSGDARCGARR